MMKNKLFDPQVVDQPAVIKRLVEESSPRKIFLVLIFISSLVATLGLLNDSAEIVIGAMLIAPLLWPILGFSMGMLVLDFRMLRMATLSILFSMGIAIITAMVITFFYVPLGTTREIIQTTDFGFMFPVALAAGAAAAFAISYEGVKEIVTGIAITVALLPPLVAIGIGLGGTDWALMRAASELFLINLIGIILISFFIFALLGFRRYRKLVDSEVKKEEKILNEK